MTPTSRPDPPTSLLFDVFALSQAVGRLLDSHMADSPLTPSEYAFYSAIFETESITPTALAVRLGMPLTTVMDHLARLEVRGHCFRMTDPLDRRATRVVLTAAGLGAHRAANASFERAYQAFENTLTRDESDLQQALAEVRAAAELATLAAPGSQKRSAIARAHSAG
jgi:DNA-binding MarR family transcriptional regulator